MNILGVFAATVGIIGFAIGVVMVGYAYMGFLSWVFSDPFDWMSSVPSVVTEEKKSSVWEEQKALCIHEGGVPIQSGWTGTMKECQFNK